MVAFTAVKNSPQDGAKLFARLLARGIITCYRPAYSTFQLMPPYTITGGEVDHFVAALVESLKAGRQTGSTLCASSRMRN